MDEEFEQHRPQGTSPSEGLTIEDIDAYLSGELSKERMREIDELVDGDSELAAKMSVIGSMCGSFQAKIEAGIATTAE